jgi:tetratricopeptide (TPR) repeat protein
MFVSPSAFAPVIELYDQSMYVRAYHAAEQIAPLAAWEGTTARILAGRLAATVGSPRLAQKLQLLAYRHDPQDWEARYYYARMMLRSRGALAAWEFLRRHDTDQTLLNADPKVHSDWLAFHAFVLAQMRDFERAEPWLARAEKVAPNNVWVWVERAKVFELQDRYEDALSVLRYALMLQPWFRPTIQTSAHALVLAGRDEEALRMLAQAAPHVECAWLVEQMANLQIELGHYADARASLERFAALSPRMEPAVREQLQAQRADAAYLSGDYEAAIEFARQGQSAALQNFAAQLEQGCAQARRVVLPVGFVRQHHLTCAPATLATLSRYYQMPAAHLDVAAEICHDGTTAHNERKWALRNGYATREFRVTWDNAVELLNRQIAFTLGTIEPGGGHLQAVIGYDSLRGTLIVRDPSHRHYSEWDAKAVLARYRACGPRGMALVPTPHAQRLNEIPLAESDSYDHLYALQDALAHHDRAKAQALYQALRQRGGEPRLMLQARLALATYDGDPAQMLVCNEKLLELFPNEINLKLSKALCLRTVAQRPQRLAYLSEICAGNSGHPLLWQEYAKELSADARQWPAALRWLRKSLRRGAPQAGSLHLLANIRWQQQRRAEALELYRFAACLDEADESYAQTFFRAAHQLKQTDEALGFLLRRVQQRGEKSGRAVQTLFQALEQIGRPQEAFDNLQTGLQKLPQDGQLKLFAAEAYARYGYFARAIALLKDAQTQTPRNEWARAAATLATYHGQWREALQCWLQVAEAEPLALDANRQVAQLLAATESPRAATDFLRERIARYPHSSRLRELLIEALRDDPAAAEVELQVLLKHDSANDWAQRRMAMVWLELRRAEEALTASEAACRVHYANPENHLVRGQALAQLQRLPEADEAYRAALRVSADHTPALINLLAAATAEERREVLLFWAQELTRQVSSGTGWLTFRELSREILTPEELLYQLREALQQRPELPLLWSALLAQLIEMQQHDDALSLAREAAERFPLVARAWFDLALAHEARQETEQQILALQRACALEPGWELVVQKLAAVYERAGKFTQARTVIEQAIAHAPLQHAHHGCLAELWWKLGEKEKALTAMQNALALAPDYEGGWRALRMWADEMRRPEWVSQWVRELTAKRPGEARSWLRLARTLKGEEVLREQLAALDTAIQLQPRLIEAHSLRAFLLADAGRYDEALRACRPAALAPTFPPELLSAEAHIIAQCGDLPKALQKMRTVLKNAPDYAPGWERLARWYRASEQGQEYLEAAQQLARLLPHYAVAHGYLGEAKLWNEDRAGAKESLQQAVTLAPDYEFAGLTLFDLHLADNELESAGAALARLEQFVGGDATTLRALQWAARHHDGGKAEKQFFALCLSPTQQTSYLDDAVAALVNAQLDEIADLVLEDALASPHVNPHVGRLWVQRCAGQNKPEHCLRRLQQMADNAGRFWHCAAQAFVEICAQNQAAEPVRQFLRKYETPLRVETASWAVAGAALYELGEVAAAVDWMNDWRERADLAPGMLWPLVLALRDLQRESEAKAVSLHAVSLPEDARTGSHLALLSLDEALAGRLTNANQHAARLTPQRLNEGEQLLVALATGLRNFHQARTEGRAIGHSVIDDLLQLAHDAPWLSKSRPLVTLFKRAIDTILTNENDTLLKVKTKLKLKWFEYRANG